MILFYYVAIVVPVLITVSAGLYWYDKRQAANGGQRIPEITLLLVDFFGGWPGGWWSQRKFRHKTRKISYRIRFYMAIAGNLFLVYWLAT